MKTLCLQPLFIYIFFFKEEEIIVRTTKVKNRKAKKGIKGTSCPKMEKSP